MVGGDDDLRGGFGEFADALQAWKRRVGKRRKLTRALTQGGLEAGHSAQRFMDDDQIEKLIPCACRLAALTSTVMKSGSGYTHSECTGVRLPCPK